MRSTQALLILGVMFGAHQSVMDADADVQTTGEAKRDKKAAKVEPKADALLRKMSTKLGSMKEFSFDSFQVMEVVTKEGEKIQGLTETHVEIARPNKMRVDRMGPLGGGSLYYDGTTFTFYGKRDNMYAQAKVPGTLDQVMDFARDQLSIEAPAADLLLSDAYTVLMEDVVSGRYLGSEIVNRQTCHHLAYRGKETDWQLWIADGEQAVPCRFVITSKKVEGSPQFTVSTTNWREGDISDEAFTFEPPKGAAKINFVTVSDKVTKQRQARRK